MKKTALLALVSVVALAMPSFAQTSNQSAAHFTTVKHKRHHRKSKNRKTKPAQYRAPQQQLNVSAS
jgi:hypothetical protein